MATVVAEPFCQSKMGTSNTGVKSQASVANGTKESASNAALASTSVNIVTRDDEELSVKSSKAAHTNGKAHRDGDAIIQRKVETALETSRKLVEQAKLRLKIQMQFVLNARRKILDETHPDMVTRLQVAAKERDHLLCVAKQRHEYFKHGTAVIYNYECDEANSEYELHCEKLRQDMLEEIHHEMEILNDQRKGGHSHGKDL